jgi:hypothetical protein
VNSVHPWRIPGRSRSGRRPLHREAPDRADDSGRRVFAGAETDEYSNAPGNAVVPPLRDLLDRDPGLKEVLWTPAPCAFEQKDANAKFLCVEDYGFGEI